MKTDSCHSNGHAPGDRAQTRMIPEPELYELADFFKVFGDSTRIRILWALDLGEMCVCDLAGMLGITKSGVSHQLKFLRQAKLVRCRREGRNVIYRLADDHVKTILETGLEHINE